jgi:hypothetical protein
MEGTLTTVQNSRKTKSKVSLSEQLIACSVTMIAAVIAGVVGAPDKWLAAIFVTVVTFAGMISYFRKSWPSKQFWAIMTAAFLIHLILVWVIFGVLLRQREDVGLLVCLPGILLECFLLYHAVRFFRGEQEGG